MMGVFLAALAIGVPAAAFTLWPLLRRGAAAPTFLALPADARRELDERKRAVLRALQELEFEHEAGHVSGDDYADLRARYEAEAAAILTELDRLGDAPAPAEEAAPATAARRSAWRHPVVVTGGAVALVLFGVALGAGVVRHTAPDPTAGVPMPGSRPLAAAPETTEGGGAPRPITPEMLRGMLQAARASFFEGRYGEAFAAYQAVLKRDPKNVDALTHVGLLAATARHGDEALALFDKALAIDPNYPPALLYRGQVLDEVKQDTEGAIRAWEKFLAVTPAGEDRDRVTRMIAEARERRSKK